MNTEESIIFNLLLNPPDEDYIVAFGVDLKPIYWRTLIHDVADLQNRLASEKGQEWILWTDEIYPFMVGLLGAIAAGCRLILPANLQIGRLADFQESLSGILSDDFFEVNGLSYQQILCKENSLSSNNMPFRLPQDMEMPRITLQTSGSTGLPKRVDKELSALETEVSVLEKTFSPQPDCIVASTVAPFHIYGLLFHILWPLCSRRPIVCKIIRFPEELSVELTTHECVILASSPAFLARIVSLIDQMPEKARLSYVFSSGGPLPENVAVAFADQLPRPVVEVFGSTETGGVAYRSVSQVQVLTAWTPFDGIEIDTTQRGQIQIRSPYMEGDGFYEMGDLVNILPKGNFHLMGRADRIAKVEEKRISLSEMERFLIEMDFIVDVRLCVLTDHQRSPIAAAIVLSSEGRSFLSIAGKNATKQKIKQWLLTKFEPVVHPRKWRFVGELPQNEQGKIETEALVRLFAQLDKRQNIQPYILHTDHMENIAILDLYIPLDLYYFNGHFEGAPVLAGVAQLDWVIKLGRSIFGHMGDFSKFEVVKFHSVIKPNYDVRLTLTYNLEKNKLVFSYDGSDSEDGDIRYSSGRVVFKNAL